METPLVQIVSFHSGIFAKPHVTGDILYLQGRHVNDNGTFSQISHPVIRLSAQTERHLLQDGDVLFAAKGQNNYAAVYTISVGKAVASSTFINLRIHQEFKDKILPQFLAWYLNQSPSVQMLQRDAKRSTVSSINTKQLEGLQIHIPDLRTQDLIVRIERLQNRKKELLKELQIQNDILFEHQLLNAIKR